MDAEHSGMVLTAEQITATGTRRCSWAKLLRAMGQTLDAQNLASLELAYHSGAYLIRTVVYRIQRADWSMSEIIRELAARLGWMKSTGSPEYVLPENSDALFNPQDI